jgi:tetratricopeptide (TPR) repeat protein
MSMVSKLWIMLTKRFGSPSGFPLFLQRSDITEYDIREAITELRTASLISYEDAGDSFSLHPLIHSWARDSLSTTEQKTWSIRAFNTLMEAIRLGSGVTDEDRMFHSSILPHLDAFFREVGGVSLLGRDTASFFQMQLARFMPPFYLWLVSDQVLHAAKCGFVMADRGYFEKAALHLQVVTNTLLNTLGMHNVKTMQAALGLAGVYWGLGRLDTAIGLQNSVVTAREHMYGPTNELTLQAMDLLGYSYWLHGYHFEALELHEQATEGMIGTLGQEHEQTLTALDHLGTSLGSLYRHEERLQIHQKVLKCRETTLGATHPDTLVTLDHIAVTLLELGRPDEAKPIITNVHRERQRQLGKEHPWTLWSLCNLAKVHTALGEPRIAETMLTWGVAAAERSLSKDHLGVLMGRGELARAYARLGKMDEAETLTVETIALLESSRGRAHPDCVFALYKLGLLYELKGDKRQAIKRYEEALNRADERITSRHPLAKEARSALAKLSGDHGPGEQSAAGQFRGAKHERKTSLKPSSTW